MQTIKIGKGEIEREVESEESSNSGWSDNVEIATAEGNSSFRDLIYRIIEEIEEQL